MASPSHPPSSVIPTQVLAVFYSDKTYIVHILCLDDSTLDPVPRRIVPNFIVKSESFDLPAFCVVRSQLYIFEGGSRGELESDSPPSTAFHTFPVESNNSQAFPVELNKSMGKKGPNMHHPKEYPIATPTPDGRSIIVCSTSLRPSDPCPLELFNISSQKWIKFPPVSSSLVPEMMPCIIITSLSFMGDDLLVFHTDSGFLKLDLNLLKRKRGRHGHGVWGEWQKRKFCDEIYDVRLDTCIAVTKDLCLTSTYAMDLSFPNDMYRYPYPEFPYPTGNYSRIVPYITQLPPCYLSTDFRFCILQMAVEEGEKSFNFLLGSYRCKLDECSKGLSEFRKKQEEEWRHYREERDRRIQKKKDRRMEEKKKDRRIQFDSDEGWRHYREERDRRIQKEEDGRMQEKKKDCRIQVDSEDSSSSSEDHHARRFSPEPEPILPGATRELSAFFYCDTPVFDLSTSACVCFSFIPPN